jgi:aminoglycoside phosphotransferase family enzyme/predicted kinase
VINTVRLLLEGKRVKAMPATDFGADPAKVRELLEEALSNADCPGVVQTIETHISWVYLTPRYAYKLKKPVRFEFLDFSTAELRHRACLDEVRLNRRLAPNVYLGVLSVTQTADGTLKLDDQGNAVDWLVHMRRLDADSALDSMLRENRLTQQNAAAIAQRLAEFYAELEPARISINDYRDALVRHIRANYTALFHELPEERDRIGRIRGAQLRYVSLHGDLFASRVEAGRIVDGHGDLRPEHIYLEDPPVVIDCIEFSNELRKVDIADELSFLAMECDEVGDCGLGDLVLAAYHARSGDSIPERLLAFYRCYRACVRAKVMALRARQEVEDQQKNWLRPARRYLCWADKYAAALGRPSLVVVCGLMGTGKSTLAAKLADAFGAEWLATDNIRRSMLGASDSPVGYGEGKYTPGLRQLVYEELLRQAAELLTRGQSVILDAAFLTRELRNRARDVGIRGGAVTLFALCDCPREIALARIRSRAGDGGSLSEARADLYDSQASEFEPLRNSEPTIAVDTQLDISRQFDAICGKLGYLLYAY